MSHDDLKLLSPYPKPFRGALAGASVPAGAGGGESSQGDRKEADGLDFSHYVTSITRILTDQTVPSGLTVGIFGDWGSGKTTLLRAVRDRLKREARPPRPIVVEFDAWEYTKDEVWVALLRQIKRTVEEELHPVNLLLSRLELWGERIDGKKLLMATVWLWLRLLTVILIIGLGLALVVGVVSQPAGGWLGQALERLSQLPILKPSPSPNSLDLLLTIMGGSALITALLSLLALFTRLVWSIVRPILRFHLILPSDLLRPAFDKGNHLAVELFHQDLTAWIVAVSRYRPIVVMIDDLDRAPVDQITPVLEAIKHLGGEFPRHGARYPIAFILAADRLAIQQAVASHYKDYWATLDNRTEAEAFAREYLEKIIHIPFHLPPLSQNALTRLLPTEEDNAAPASLAWARQQARAAFLQAPKANPRAVIQTYNTFQLVWLALPRPDAKPGPDRQDLRYDPALPGLVATLVLIRYVWYSVFQAIVRYPELFFDLHALASKKDNEVCSALEIEELLLLGCPAAATLPMLERIRTDHLDLLRVLAALTLPEKLDVNQLYGYLTLIPGTPAPTDPYLVESGMALMSGDPSLVKFAVRVGGDRRERLITILERLEEPGAKHGDEKETIRALFALGRMRDERAAESIKRVIADADYSTAVKARAIFALAHLAYNSPSVWQTVASRALGDLLLDAKALLHLRLAVMQVLNSAGTQRAVTSVPVDLSRLYAPVAHTALYGEVGVLRSMAVSVVQSLMKQGDSTPVVEAVHAAVTDGSQRNPDFNAYLAILETAPTLPQPVLDDLVGRAADPNFPQHQGAFELLANRRNPSDAVALMAKVACLTQASSLREAAILKMGERQAALDDANVWAREAWEAVERVLAQPAAPELGTLIQALGATRREEALPYLEKYLGSAEQRIKKSLQQALDKIATDGQTSSAKARAEELLDQAVS